MKPKHKCLYCQHTASRMWNLKRHMQSVHGIQKTNNYVNSDDVIPHYQSKYQLSQEEHQYGKRFKDASTQYSENDINHSTIPYDATNTADQKSQEKEASLMKTIACHQLVSDEYEYDQMPYDATKSRDESCKKRKPIVINSKGVFILE